MPIVLVGTLLAVGGPWAGAGASPAPSGAHVGPGVRPSVLPPNPYPNDMAASIVVGQPNFTANSSSTGAATSATDFGNQIYAAVFDAKGDLWVADYENNRVLEFPAPVGSGAAASVVLGQSGFQGSQAGTGPANLSGPDGLAFDAQGDLWVADYFNDRVLEFAPPFTTGGSARLVLGQTSFAGSYSGTTATNLTGPAGLAFHNGNLWVCDYGNNRTLEFQPPFANGSAATLVLGQASFTSFVGATTASSLWYPEQIAFDPAGNAWIADYNNSRVLEFPTPLSTGEVATAVLGQPGFTTNSSPDPSALAGPNGLWFDDRGNLWVADTGDNRTMEYQGPTPTSLASPIAVLGEPDLYTYTGGAGPTGETYPSAVVTDPAGNLWIVDEGNSRILGFRPPHYPLTFTATGLPAGSNWTLVVNGTTYTEPLSGSVGLSVENGSFPWSSPTAPHGFQLPYSTGSAVVNGSAVTVVLAFRPFSYPVTFNERGLGTGTSWSVMVGGATAPSSSGTSLVVNETNGTYGWTVAAVSGYSVVPRSGNVTVNGSAENISLQFQSTGSTGFLGLSTEDWALIIVPVALVGAVVIAVVLVRRRR